MNGKTESGLGPIPQSGGMYVKAQKQQTDNKRAVKSVSVKTSNNISKSK